MKKKFNWVIKSKHILIIMILVCLSLMALAAAVKLPAGPVKNIVGYAVIPFQKGNKQYRYSAGRCDCGTSEQAEALVGRKSAAPG